MPCLVLHGSQRFSSGYVLHSTLSYCLYCPVQSSKTALQIYEYARSLRYLPYIHRYSWKNYFFSASTDHYVHGGSRFLVYLNASNRYWWTKSHLGNQIVNLLRPWLPALFGWSCHWSLRRLEPLFLSKRPEMVIWLGCHQMSLRWTWLPVLRAEFYITENRLRYI